MSRGYSGTTDKSIVDSSPISGDVFTFSSWVAYDTDNNAGQVCVALTSQSSTQNQAFLNCSFDFSSTVNFSIRRSGTYYHAYTTNSLTANGGWNHLAGVMVGVSERYSYLNGDVANKGTNTTTITSLAGLFNRTNVGSLYPATTNQQTTQGRVAHPAIWNAALTDAEIVMLSQGVSPLLVRPESLVFYVPYLGRDTSDIDIEGGVVLTNTGTTSETSEPRVTRPTDKNSTRIFLPPTPVIGIGTPVSTAITISGTVDVSVTLANPNDGLIVVVKSSNWSNNLPDSAKSVIFDPGGANEQTILSTDATLWCNTDGQFIGQDAPCAIFHFTKSMLPSSGTYTVRWSDTNYSAGSTVIGAIPVSNGGNDIRVRQKAIAYNNSAVSGVTISPLTTEFEKNTNTGSLVVAVAGSNNQPTTRSISLDTSLFSLIGGTFGDSFLASYSVNPTPFKSFNYIDTSTPARNVIIGVEFESGSTPITGSMNFSANAASMARVAEAVRNAYPYSMFAMVKPYSVPAAIGASTDRQFGVLVMDDSATNTNFQRLNLANSDFGSSTTGYPVGYIVGMARSRFQSSSINNKLTSNASYYQLNQWSALGATWATAATTPEIKTYKDGVESSVSINNSAVSFSGNINETIIGREATALANDGRNFDGLISRVAIWSVALTAAEMESLYNGADPKTIQSASLVCYWPGEVIGVKAYNAAVGQYMNEVKQGKYALLSNGAVSVYEDPPINTVNATASGLLGTLNSFSITGSAVWYPGQRMYPNAAALTNLSGSFADIDDDPDSPDVSWLIQI